MFIVFYVASVIIFFFLGCLLTIASRNFDYNFLVKIADIFALLFSCNHTIQTQNADTQSTDQISAPEAKPKVDIWSTWGRTLNMGCCKCKALSANLQIPSGKFLNYPNFRTHATSPNRSRTFASIIGRIKHQ